MFELVDYDTRPVCLEARQIIRRRFRDIEAAVPEAKWVPWDKAFNWRFTERLTEQVLLQKLARQISGVQTVDLLLLAGHLQEIGVLYRMLDEIEEDIMFLVLGIQTGNWTLNHDKYVAYFWSEDDSDKQPPVRRKVIRGFVNRAWDHGNPSTGDAIGRLLHKVFSDFVHVRSAPIMGMVKGPPPRFDLNGIHDEDARNPYVEHNPTYFYRCLISCCAIANVALTEHEQEIIYDEVKRFEQKYRELLFGAYAAHP